MDLFKRIFGQDKSDFIIKFSKTQNSWEVYLQNDLIYIGEKDACERFMTNIKKQYPV
ncbi:MAG: hypothetical protein JXR03_05025 [Cyclobacteriaceae bacterium]